MNPVYESLHTEMLQDIQRCLQLELPEQERVESCFWIGNNYWDKLKSLVKDKPFVNEDEEINFFREVKPNFTMYIEYFVLLAESLQFIPVDPVSAREYWQEESKRFDRFCSRNETFIEYIESGERHGDAMYFLRDNNNRRAISMAPLVDTDQDFLTSHDHIMRSYLAYKKYNGYVMERIEQLNQAN